VTVVISLQAVGVALVLAMLITPPATAQLFTRRLGRMKVIAALLGFLSGAIGLYVSFYVGIASGAAIVLVATALFLLALAFAPRRGSPLPSPPPGLILPDGAVFPRPKMSMKPRDVRPR